MSVPPRADVRRLVEAPVLGRLLAGRLVAGPRPEDGLRVAAGLAAGGTPVALEHRPGVDDDADAELAALLAGAPSAGPLGNCELTLPVDRLDGARALGARAAAVGFGIALEGCARRVDELLSDLPAARVVVASGERDAEARCRALAGGRVRLRAGRGHGARLAFVRCLDVLLAGTGEPAVATSDLRLIAITGERAAWHGRSPESWEHVMPWGIRTAEQQRLAAAGSTVRIAVPSGRGAVVALAGRAGSRR
ncbi:L-proline dehydrogenase [Blastococcus fimeti]|nr:L-proline dehydrogenase [Blastococcus fimeti]